MLIMLQEPLAHGYGLRFNLRDIKQYCTSNLVDSFLEFFGKNRLNLRRLTPVLLVAAVGLGACTRAPRPSGFNDPYEAQNREVHQMNKAIDKAVVRPLSKVYGTLTKGPISKGVSNFSANLSLPGIVANDLLQLNLKDAIVNSLRFTMNSTVGLGGLFDVATQNGLTERSTDFGQTLFVWGAPEGAYIVLPLLGPSTERAAVGSAVDFFLDPLKHVLNPSQQKVVTTARLLNKLGDRYKYSDLIDSILYNSVGGYAQERLLYLQSRRMKLFGTINDATLADPYAQ